MNGWSPLRFFIPHAISVVCFGAAFIWILIVNTNRTELDLYLGGFGFVGLAAALISSIAGVVVVFLQGVGRYWPWLLAHLGGIALPLIMGFFWIGAHLV